MKKFASLILALAMTFSLCISAGAVEQTLSGNGDASLPLTSDAQNVNVTVTDGTHGGIVYHVKVEWTNLTFEYQKEGEGTWDPESHTYNDVTTNGWVGGEGNTITREGVITVTNHSNAPVDVAAVAEEVATGFTVTFDEQNDKVDLVSADDDAYRAGTGNYDDDDLKAVYDITVTTAGVPAAGVAAKAKVVISKHTPTP